MKKKKVLGVSLLIAILGLGSVVGCRSFRHASPEKKINYVAEHIADELELNDSQIVKLDQLKADVLEKYKEIKAKKRADHAELIKKIRNDEISRAYLYNLAAKKEALHKELKPFIIDRVLEFYDILTAEQKKLLADKLQKFHKRFE
jgi:Spy/CpxP family protein refolding chaperone